ncbi:MAG: cytochrome P450 [Myxococcota bacterium]
MFDAKTFLEPISTLDRLREQSPVLRVEALDAWLILRYEDVKRVLQDAQTFSSEDPSYCAEQIGAPTMLDLDNPRHAQLRTLVQPAFTPRRVAKLADQIGALCEEMLDEVEGRGERFDLVDAFSGPLPAIVIAELLGVPRDDFGEFRRLASDAIHVGTPDKQEIGVRALRELNAYYGGILKERRASGRLGDDIASDLIRAQQDGAACSDADLEAMGGLFLIAGHETTTNLINNTVRCLSEHPAARDYLREHPDRMSVLLEEVLRYRSPVLGNFRFTRQAVELQGVTIPAGARVLPQLLAANHDPRVFSEPGRFIPDRNPKGTLAFGRGIHKCIGERLSKLEATLALTALYRRFPTLRVDDEREIIPVESPIIYGCRVLPVRI